MRYLYVLLLGVASCAQQTQVDEEPVTVAVGRVTPTSVQTAAAAYTGFQYIIQSNGKIRSVQEYTVVSESDGAALVCKAVAGAQYAKGDLIIQLETTQLGFKLERARLAEFNAKKEFESQLLGYENLLRDRSAEEADAIRRKLMISSGLAGAQQDVKEITYQLGKATIRAPLAGRVTDVEVQTGMPVKAGQTLFRMYDPGGFVLETKVLEADALQLRTGMAAEVAPVSTPDKKFNATVQEINPSVDADGMVSIKLLIACVKNALLFPGMNCAAFMKVPVRRSLVIPKDALVMRNGRAVVFTMEDGKAKWNYVQVGKNNGKEIEITSGLKDRDKVITTANLQLADEAPVVEEEAGLLSDKNFEN